MESNNNLAKISLAINAVLIIAVVILFTRGSAESAALASIENDSTGIVTIAPNDSELKIGYFNTDSLNKKLLLVKDLETDIAQAQKDAEQQMANEQVKIDRWKKKWEARMPLLTGEQEKYNQEMQQLQMEAMQMEQQVQMQLGQKQESIMLGHVQRISNFSKIYAEENGFDVVMSLQLGQNPIYIHPSMDITAGIVKILNDDYNSTFSSDAEDKSAETEG